MFCRYNIKIINLGQSHTRRNVKGRLSDIQTQGKWYQMDMWNYIYLSEIINKGIKSIVTNNYISKTQNILSFYINHFQNIYF